MTSQDNLEVYTCTRSFSEYCTALRSTGARVGLVPTMGALHAGHMTLVEAIKRQGAVPLLTVFVNPLQFGPNEDLDRYPRDLAGDLELCRSHGVQAVFCPSVAEMYPPGEQTRVSTGDLGLRLCGASRPDHFDGVCTVVTKLLAIAGPCLCAFGRKDYQQLAILRRLVVDLHLPVEVVGVPIAREADGLAMSSRNRYLDASQRQQALGLSRAIRLAQERFESGIRSVAVLRESLAAVLDDHGLRVDYLAFASPERLEPVEGSATESVLLAMAAYVGNTRLIDNCVLGEERLLPLEGP